MQILIDGYNLLNIFAVAGGRQTDDVESREDLIGILDSYRRVKRHKITLCFDAYRGLSLQDTKEKELGVRVVYTGRGKTTDDYIKEYVEKASRKRVLNPDHLVVVTSDREIVEHVQRFGVESISSEEFVGSLEMSMMMEMNGHEMEDEEAWDNTTKKKGPSKRLSKKERKRNQIKKKL